MSFLSTGGKLIGKFSITNHAVDRFKERHGDSYVGNKKIKNMGSNRVRREIVKSLLDKRKRVKEQNDGSLVVFTEDFKAIVVPEFKNKVVTII